MSKRHGTHVILGAITPAYDSVDADQLTYPYLRAALKSQNLPAFLKQSGVDLLHQKLKFSPSLVQEELRSVYLLNAAYRLQKAWTPPEKLFWSTQFTTTSVKLFGRPLSREVSSIAAHELEYFETAITLSGIDADFAEPVVSAYRSLLSARANPLATLEQRYGGLLERVHDYFLHEYEECFKVFEQYDPDVLLSATDIATCFTSVLDILKSQDDAWSDWTVAMDKSAKLSVNVHKKKIIVGQRRQPADLADVRGLLAHEILVHAQRAVQGAKRSRDLAIGLPDYLAAEEGLGVLIESAVNGSVPAKVKDRYIDIALALGAWRRRPLLRNEMYVFCYSRAVIRSIVAGDALDLDMLEKVTWEHVNRIYRGGLGNKYIAVFTKDVAYYRGFVSMANYLQNSLKRGRLADSLAYVYRGKFDPTNPAHNKHVKSIGH